MFVLCLLVADVNDDVNVMMWMMMIRSSIRLLMWAAETLTTNATGSGDGSLMPAVDFAVGDDDDTKSGTVSATTIAPGTGSTVSGNDSTSMLEASTNNPMMVLTTSKTGSNMTEFEAPSNYTATTFGNSSMTNESVSMVPGNDSMSLSTLPGNDSMSLSTLPGNDSTVPQNSSVSLAETDFNTTTSETNSTVPDITVDVSNSSIVAGNDSTSMSEASTNTSMMVFNTSETDSNTTYAEAPGNYSAMVFGNSSMTNESLSTLPGNDSMSLPMLPGNDSTVPQNSSVSLEETDLNTTTSETNFTVPDGTIYAGNGSIVAGNDSTTMLETSTNTSMMVFNTSETDSNTTYAEAPGNYSATVFGNSSMTNESLSTLPGNDSMSLPVLPANDSVVPQNSSVSLAETDLNTTTSETNFTVPGNGSMSTPEAGFTNMSEVFSTAAQETGAVTVATGSATTPLPSGTDNDSVTRAYNASMTTEATAGTDDTTLSEWRHLSIVLIFPTRNQKASPKRQCNTGRTCAV